jgi:hypothetical protein
MSTCSRSAFHRLAAAWLDDDAAIHAALLLQMGVRVKPVGAAVPQRELKGVRGARLDRRCGDMRHAVFFVRQQQAVPVRGGFLVLEIIVDADAGEVALTEAQHRAGNAAIDGEHADGPASGALDVLGDVQVVFDDTLTGSGLGIFATGIAGQSGRGTESQESDEETQRGHATTNTGPRRTPQIFRQVEKMRDNAASGV